MKPIALIGLTDNLRSVSVWTDGIAKTSHNATELSLSNGLIKWRYELSNDEISVLLEAVHLEDHGFITDLFLRRDRAWFISPFAARTNALTRNMSQFNTPWARHNQMGRFGQDWTNARLDTHTPGINFLGGQREVFFSLPVPPGTPYNFSVHWNGSNAGSVDGSNLLLTTPRRYAYGGIAGEDNPFVYLDSTNLHGAQLTIGSTELKPYAHGQGVYGHISDLSIGSTNDADRVRNTIEIRVKSDNAGGAS